MKFCFVWDLYLDEAASFAGEIFSDVMYDACVIDAADRGVERENPIFFFYNCPEKISQMLRGKATRLLH